MGNKNLCQKLFSASGYIVKLRSSTLHDNITMMI